MHFVLLMEFSVQTLWVCNASSSNFILDSRTGSEQNWKHESFYRAATGRTLTEKKLIFLQGRGLVGELWEIWSVRKINMLKVTRLKRRHWKSKQKILKIHSLNRLWCLECVCRDSWNKKGGVDSWSGSSRP